MLYRRILIIFKKNYESAATLANSIGVWLEGRGYAVALRESGKDDSITGYDLVITLGGDGTILGAARKIAGQKVPILGINFGRVGFLCACEPDNWREQLEKVFSRKAPILSCMALGWRLFRGNIAIAEGVAANEVALSRGTLARLICVEIKIDNDYLGVLRGDGLVCCSPLGSSGYSVSAGGPLINSRLNVIGMTPVCPFLTNVRPLVASGDSTFSLRVHQTSAVCYLTIDGQDGQCLEAEDRLEITGIKDALIFLGGETSFFDRLEARGLSLEKKL